ncbi:hypothetical protein [Saccharothrix sp. Mg75]|uniref:hypothetical protein n=1 Tax=Saccharothrix sp. Mg75 TaxID=3445357 RepID=UPI003EE96823
MDGFGTGFGPDGTQEPPPPPLFADPLAGLVTGEAAHRSAAVTPVAVPPPVVVPPVAVPPAPRRARRAPVPNGPQPVVHPPFTGLPQVTSGAPRNGRALAGCLVVLAVLGALLFPVLREIIEAVVDLLR